VLLVDQRLEHLADHSEMVAVALELALEVDEIGGRGIQAFGEQFAEHECDLGMRFEEALGVLEYERVDR
jgi:hypothetical protein